jgi:hypothetical protein
MTDEVTGGRRCPWCSAPAGDEDIRCPACGAALAQREDVGGLLIPGVTTVDPALADIADRPIHLRASSPSQGVAPMLAAGALVGGPIGLAALAGAGGIVAAEWMGAKGGAHADAPAYEDVGRTSEVARDVVERLDREERALAAQVPGVEAAAGTGEPPAPSPTPPAPATADEAPWPQPPSPPRRP